MIERLSDGPDQVELRPGHSISKAKLTDIAHQFEASLMHELMQPFQGHETGIDSEDEEEGVSSNALSDFSTDAMAKSISAHGGFGIASTVLKYLEQNGKISD